MTATTQTGPTDANPLAEWPIPSAPVTQWAGDHWTTLAYLQTCVVSNKGNVNLLKMRCHSQRHPGLAQPTAFGPRHGERYPTRLKGNAKLMHHDDWDCLEDLAYAGLVIDLITGMGNGKVGLTELGRQVCEELRVHRDVQDKASASFRPSEASLRRMEANLEQSRLRRAAGKNPQDVKKDIAAIMASLG